MKLRTKSNGKEVNFDKRHFLAKGGEGEIYAKGGVVYKVCEPGKMIPSGKFNELAVLTDIHIIKPEDTIIDNNGVEVGYTMKHVDDTYTLCQLFTKAFRLRNNVGPDTMLKLIRQMQETIHFVHNKKILLVDLNELNFLVGHDFKDVWFIDVNSYQTPSYKATAIMDSIRDRHCHNNAFNEGTDWFSFAIVSFQMFMGIHPYKGKHHKYTDPKSALDERMKNNISILNPEVTYPQAACQQIGVIPDVYLEWYKAVLEKGMRIAPPFDLVAGIRLVAAIKQVTGSNVFDMKRMYEFINDITRHYYQAGKEVVVTKDQVFYERHGYQLPSPDVKNIVFTSKQSRPIAAWLNKDQVKLYDLMDKKDIPFICNGTHITDYAGRLYVQNGMNIIEVVFTEMGSNILASPHIVGTCMEKNAVFYDGVVIQDMFGTFFVSMFPESKQCRQFAMKELHGYRLVDAKYDNRVLMVVGVNKKGEYDRFVFRFAKDWSGYDLRVVTNVSYSGLNFTVLDKGVCICMTEEEKIEIFMAEKDAQGLKQFADPAIKSDMQLSHQGNQTIFTRGKELFSITVRPATAP